MHAEVSAKSIKHLDFLQGKTLEKLKKLLYSTDLESLKNMFDNENGKQ